MGLDIFDFAKAAGAGLSVIGAERKENRKEELALKLEKDREARREQYTINAEDRATAREKAKPAGPPEFLQQADGTFQKIYKNSFGEELKREPATATEIEDFEMGRKARKVSLDNLIVDGKYKGALTAEAEARAADIPETRSLQHRLTESQIRENDAQAARAGRPDKSEEFDDSVGGLTNELIKDTADLAKQYTSPESDFPITPDEYRMVAEQAIQEAARMRKDATVVFRAALRNYVDRRKNRKGK